MQKVRVKDVKTIPMRDKEGSRYIIIGEDGAEFSGFDTKLADITSGSLIELEPEVKGKYINIKDGWKILEAGTGITPSGATTQATPLSPQESIYLQQLELRSREGIAALAELGLLIRTPGTAILKPSSALIALYEEALETKTRAFLQQPPPAAKPAPKTEPKAKAQAQPAVKPREEWDKVTQEDVPDYPHLEPIIWRLCKLQPAGMYKELGFSNRAEANIPVWDAFLALRERFVPAQPSDKSQEPIEELFPNA